MGKPLISDGQMLAMHAAMVRLRELHAAHAVTQAAGAGASGLAPGRPDVALLAATLLQLRPCDTLVTDDDAHLAAEVLAMAQDATFSPEHTATHLGFRRCEALFAAGYAHAQCAQRARR